MYRYRRSIRKLKWFATAITLGFVLFTISKNNSSNLLRYRQKRDSNKGSILSEGILKKALLQLYSHLIEDDEEAVKLLEKHDNETRPGVLVCAKRKAATPISFRSSGNQAHDENTRTAREKNFKFWLPPIRPIGCCPPGDPNGVVYKTGESCCVDKIYKTSTHFCCIEKGRVLEMGSENLDYCYSTTEPYCRVHDVGMQRKVGMNASCEYGDGTPTKCNITCAKGSNVKGQKHIKCLPGGVWDSVPECCEGCPTNHRLDMWFVVQASVDLQQNNFNQIRKYIKDAISYFPVSQDYVRVGITMYSDAVTKRSGVWRLTSFQSHGNINVAIDAVNLEGTGSNLGAALNWVRNGFAEGSKPTIPNLTIIILNDRPSDDISVEAEKLKLISEVKVVQIGTNVSDEITTKLSSNEANIVKVKRFEDLGQYSRDLYIQNCGEHCQ